MSYLYESLQSIKTDWKEVVKSYDFTNLNKFLWEEYETYGEDIKIFPPKPLIFNCFNFFDINELKVVILGQDPYIKEGQAMGLAFSVPEDIRVPPSLRNVIKEINRSMDKDKSLKNGDLTNWAEQGVLLLNTALTVRQFKSNSHGKTKLWDGFIEMILKYINKNCDGLVFMLWGNNAMKYDKFINEDKHNILKSGHPSPLNRSNPFLGNIFFLVSNKTFYLQFLHCLKLAPCLRLIYYYAQGWGH